MTFLSLERRCRRSGVADLGLHEHLEVGPLELFAELGERELLGSVDHSSDFRFPVFGVA